MNFQTVILATILLLTHQSNCSQSLYQTSKFRSLADAVAEGREKEAAAGAAKCRQAKESNPDFCATATVGAFGGIVHTVPSQVDTPFLSEAEMNFLHQLLERRS